MRERTYLPDERETLELVLNLLESSTTGREALVVARSKESTGLVETLHKGGALDGLRGRRLMSNRERRTAKGESHVRLAETSCPCRAASSNGSQTQPP